VRRRAALAAFLVLAANGLGAQRRSARIGYLSVAVPEADGAWLRTFRDQLRALGYAEGRNLILEQRYARGHADKLGALADELLALKVDLIVVYGAWHIVDKLRGATPVVFTVVPDPVAQGMVTSLARPGGNMTGFSDAHSELVPKRLELIREVIPKVSRVAVLHFPSDMALMQLRIAQAAAPAQGLTLLPMAVKGPNPEEIDRVFALMATAGVGAVLVLAEPTMSANRKRIADQALKHRLVGISTVRDWAEAGFVLSYGTNFHDLWRRSAVYADKILRGAKPGDLPIEQPTKFDLILNQRTAKAIGVDVPRAFVLRADHVIE
jgi:putative ABC transport system substrate-binding protein